MTRSQKALSERKFQALVRRTKRILSSAEGAASAQKLTAFWKVGELIAAERIAREAGYHNSVLRDLARETGLALRTLQRAVVFHETYKAPPTGDGLSWSHYRVLLQLPTKQQRDFYARLARESRWTTKQLQAAVSQGLHTGEPPEKPKLTRPHDPSYLYKAHVTGIIDGDTLDLLIELGFYTLTRHRVRFAQIDAPAAETREGRAAKTFVAEQLLAARTVVVKTIKTDTYGRFVVHLFVAPTETSIAECFVTGTHLNDLLVRKGHAVVVH